MAIGSQSRMINGPICNRRSQVAIVDTNSGLLMVVDVDNKRGGSVFVDNNGGRIGCPIRCDRMETENVFLFVPNLIGYARIILAVISFYFMPTDWTVAVTCYCVSGLLDAFDGHAARLLNQSTKFGAILDQLTDRCGTMCLLVTLSNFYPKYMFWFQLSMSIDIAGHWIYLHSSLLQGRTSHKFIDLGDNPIMHMYYTSRPVLFFMCLGNEAFFAALYAMHFAQGPLIAGVGLFRLICYVSFPIMFVKTVITLIHMYVACCNIATIDVKERQDAKKK